MGCDHHLRWHMVRKQVKRTGIHHNWRHGERLAVRAVLGEAVMGEQCADGGALDIRGVGMVGVRHTASGDPCLYMPFAHHCFREGLQHQILGAFGPEIADHTGVRACGGAAGQYGGSGVLRGSGDEANHTTVVFGVFDEGDAQRVLCVPAVDCFHGGCGIVHVEAEVD